MYGETFPEPQALLTRAARLPGTDGRKMSKSYGNAIFLGEAPDEVARKIDGMLTDPQRTHRHIPGNPEVCPVFGAHRVFSTGEVQSWSDSGCRTAAIGCRDCKAALRESVLRELAPIAERRRALAADPAQVERVLDEGAAAARAAAAATMARVRRVMRIER
jgi:tryptophanyl-tRNA synthetase